MALIPVEAAVLLNLGRSSVVTPGTRLMLVSELLLQRSSLEALNGELFSSKSTKRAFSSKTKACARKLS